MLAKAVSKTGNGRHGPYQRDGQGQIESFVRRAFYKASPPSERGLLDTIENSEDHRYKKTARWTPMGRQTRSILECSLAFDHSSSLDSPVTQHRPLSPPANLTVQFPRALSHKRPLQQLQYHKSTLHSKQSPPRQSIHNVPQSSHNKQPSLPS